MRVLLSSQEFLSTLNEIFQSTAGESIGHAPTNSIYASIEEEAGDQHRYLDMPLSKHLLSNP